MRHKVRNPEKIIAGALSWAAGLSVLLMTTGLGLLLVKGEPANFRNDVAGLWTYLAGAAALEPHAIMTLGILVLLLTPVVGVLAAGISFLLIERDTKYAMISLGVLVILAFSFFVPGLK